MSSPAAEKLRDWALLLFCNLTWASQFVMVKLVQREMGPFFATFFPMAIATLFLIPIVRWKRDLSSSPNPRKSAGTDLRDFLLIGVLGQVAAQLFITWGSGLSRASNAALLSLTLPVSTSVMAYLFLGERMTRVRLLSFALAIAGVLQCSGIRWGELNLTGRRFLIGNLLIFLSVNGSSFYNTYSKKLLLRYSPLQVMLYSYFVVLAFLFPITISLEPKGFRNLPHYGPVVWLGLVILALFQYFLSMVVFLTVLSRLDATQAGLMNYLIPVFGLLLAAWILGERLTWAMILGGLLVLGSTLLITVYEAKMVSREPSNPDTPR